MQKWELIPITNEHWEADKAAIRLNSLGSLFFFESYTLGRDKLTTHFHQPMIELLESNDFIEHPLLLECPRDHYKTAMVSEGLTMWWALPFNERDEFMMRELGYGDDWIKWMRYVHNPNIRILTVSEIIDNATKIGHRIDWHFQENVIFKEIFKEILPTTKETWNDKTKQIKAASRGPHGEGTFDYLGVGGALQSRHYHGIIEDDLVGKDALKSEIVMADTIDYHRLLSGGFEGGIGRRIVVNNRWNPWDLSNHIRANEKRYIIVSHSTEGGCGKQRDAKGNVYECPHPPDTPVFPEVFPLEVLQQIKEAEGPYFYSHQYLNLAIMPEECIFKPEWVRYYSAVPNPDRSGRSLLHHEAKDKEIIQIPDLNPNLLHRTMIVDPNHAGEEGRSRHAIVVTGLDPETDRVYLLDVWAKSLSTDELLRNIYRLGNLWGLQEFWLETVAAQKYLKHYIEHLNRLQEEDFERKSRNPGLHSESGRPRKTVLRVRDELKTERSKNGKRTRIESLEPLFRDGRIWVRRDQLEFIEEYNAFPGGRTWDVLDALGYAPQTWNAIYARGILDKLRDKREKRFARHTITGY